MEVEEDDGLTLALPLLSLALTWTLSRPGERNDLLQRWRGLRRKGGDGWGYRRREAVAEIPPSRKHQTPEGCNCEQAVPHETPPGR